MEVLMSDAEKNLMIRMIQTAPPDAQFIEFGSGGSTVMFADHLHDDQKLISIEHNPVWFKKVSEELENHPGKHRIELHHLPPCNGVPIAKKLADGTEEIVPEHEFRPYSSPYEEVAFGLESYIWMEDIYVDWKNVGFVLVDGIARGSVLAAIQTRLEPGRLVLIHDYPGRELWYDWATRFYNRVGICGGVMVLEVLKR